MLRCCASSASDPLLRRPFFIADADPSSGMCQFLIYQRGRGSRWLAHLAVGMPIDMLGPLGHGWMVRPEVSNLLLIGEEPRLGAVLSLLRRAIAQEISITLLHLTRAGELSYPAALLPPEVEYQVVVGSDQPASFAGLFDEYLTWADGACCSVVDSTIEVLAGDSVRWRAANFAQVALERPLICASGVCLACQVELRQGSRLICRDGPIFSFSELLTGV
jgi:dihydroorotate dehydrogenase electron transfer subunit